MPAYSALRLSTLSLAAAAAVSLASLAISGCATGDIATNPAAAPIGAITIEGKAMGGYQGIVGGNVVLWETDPLNGGYPNKTTHNAVIVAGSLTNSGAITTGAGGSFSISTYNSFTCAPGNFFYLTVTGGSTNGVANGQINNNVVLASALGPCSQFASSPSGNSLVKVTANEATTVAFAYALGNFTYVDNTNPGLQGVYVGAPANNNAATGSCTGTGSSMTCVAAGLAHAFQNAYNLVDAYHLDGTSPTSARSTIPGNPYASVPEAEINLIANVLQYCTNSTGTTTGFFTNNQGNSDSTNCGKFLTDAKPATCGTGTAGTACTPVDLLTGAMDIARSPNHNATSMTSGLPALASGITAFQPALSSLQPSGASFALAITYTGPFGNTSTATGILTAGTATTAGTGYTVGDVLTVPGGTGGTFTVASLTSTGAGVSTVTVSNGGSGYTSASNVAVTGGTGSGAVFATTAAATAGSSPQYLALDANDDVFVTAGDLPTATQGGVSAFASNGAPLWATGFSPSFCVPKYVATDTVGNVWATNGASATSGTTCGGTASAPAYGIFGYSQTSGTLNANSPSAATGGQIAGSSNPYGIAVDQYNNLWFDRYVTSGATIYELKYSGGASPGGTYGNQIDQATGLANLNEILLDGNQNVWFSTYSSAATNVENLYVLPNQNAPATYGGTQSAAPSYPGNAATTPYYSFSGPGTTGNTGYSFGLAIDGAGNAWDTASGGANSSPSGSIIELTTPTTGTANGGLINGNPTATSISIASAPTKVQEAEFDGSGQLWTAYYSSAGEIYYAINPTSSATEKGIAPCYAPNVATTCTTAAIGDPVALQVDSTGSIWVSGKGLNTGGTGNGTVAQFIGSAAPTWPQLSYAHFGVEPQ